jgi:hypothetical protein
MQDMELGRDDPVAATMSATTQQLHRPVALESINNELSANRGMLENLMDTFVSDTMKVGHTLCTHISVRFGCV